MNTQSANNPGHVLSETDIALQIRETQIRQLYDQYLNGIASTPVAAEIIPKAFFWPT